MNENLDMVNIPVYFTEGELARIARAAHIENVTINDFMIGALEAAVSETMNPTEDIAESQEEYTEFNKEEFLEDINMLSTLLNTAIETGMLSLNLSNSERYWLAKALDDSFSVVEVSNKLKSK